LDSAVPAPLDDVDCVVHVVTEYHGGMITLAKSCMDVHNSDQQKVNTYSDDAL